ncbi:DNA primase [Pelotomaculum sp. PtaB.Bin117]|uniref:DNA primase n=1 Tax=Pelotomaculum sp. PtaB.Bin117 TaxID=1811694 RepID=UPI0009D15858|nr:DNA primase [Pelotomaculum sp. PtaB.Bin117]OPX87090.1 MAG: DNA primase [Pelotomaculum sp. PtaB.Bin117]
MGYISDELIETVRLQSDIVEVVSRYVQLKKKGKYFTGSCPFHQDSTPSFTVTPDKQIFHCFGCNTGGNVFKFLMLKENLTFVEAVSQLAQQAGIAIPVNESPHEREKEHRWSRLRQINSLAMDYFFNICQRHDAAAGARKYLTGRGLSREILERFQVGYALPGWDSLLSHLKGKGYQSQEVAEAGLAIKTEKGKYYDRFRQRIILPVWDAAGRVVGFGGRVLDQSLPKYINTPETALFNKGRLLYGLHQARSAIREKGYVIIMEGYMDVITAHHYGITNAVASLGTSLTRDQGKLMMNYNRNIVLAYDADAAGVAATMRSLDLLQELGCLVRVVKIPDGKDPDEFLRKHGYQPWENLIDQAPSLIEYKLQQAFNNRPVKTVSDKLEIMHQVFPSVAGLKSEVEVEESLKAITRFLNSSPEAVRGEFKRFKAIKGKKWSNTDDIVKIKHNRINDTKKASAREKAEAGLLRLILEEPSLVAIVMEKLGPVPFSINSYYKLLQKVQEAFNRPVYQPAELFNYLGDDEQTLLSYLLTREIPGEDRVQMINSYVEFISRCNRQERRRMLLQKINEAEKSGEHWLYHNLWNEYILLRGIAEAERLGDRERTASLLQEYQQYLKKDTWKHPREGSDGS